MSFRSRGPQGDPFEFYTDGSTIYLPTLSLRFFADLCLANAWLNAHGFDGTAVRDYVGLLFREARASPTAPLSSLFKTLGIPANAREETAVADRQNRNFRNTVVFLLAHELGHALKKHRADLRDPPQRRTQESKRILSARKLRRASSRRTLRMRRRTIGFALFLSVMANGPAGNVAVMLLNQGNIKPGQLPVPPGAKPVYVGDSTAVYETETGAPATADAVRKLVLAKGWIPYGSAGDSAFYKQNAILVTTTVSVAPAQNGKSTIQFTGELISADLPAPPDAEDLRYGDQPPELTFETAASQDAVVDFYRKNLATAGWQSTLDHTVAVDDKPTMIFRNPEKEMLTLSFFGAARGKLGTSIRAQPRSPSAIAR